MDKHTFCILHLNVSGRDQLLALIELHLHPPLLYKFMPLSFQRHCNGRLAPEQHLFSPPLVLTIKRGLWCSCIDMLTKRCINCQFWVLMRTKLKRIKIFLMIWLAELHLQLYSWLHTIYCWCSIGKCQWNFHYRWMPVLDLEAEPNGKTVDGILIWSRLCTLQPMIMSKLSTMAKVEGARRIECVPRARLGEEMKCNFNYNDWACCLLVCRLHGEEFVLPFDFKHLAGTLANRISIVRTHFCCCCCYFMGF